MLHAKVGYNNSISKIIPDKKDPFVIYVNTISYNYIQKKNYGINPTNISIHEKFQSRKERVITKINEIREEIKNYNTENPVYRIKHFCKE